VFESVAALAGKERKSARVRENEKNSEIVKPLYKTIIGSAP
jgi:hypothetical protein